MSSLYQTGGITFPIPDSLITDNLFQADPFLNLLFDLLQTAINFELGKDGTTVQPGSPWDTATTGTALAGSNPVADRCFHPPTPERTREAQVAWPLLAIYHVGEGKSEAWSTEIDVEKGQTAIDWIMSPLDAEATGRLAGALKIVVRIIKDTLWRGGHPAFMGGVRQLCAEDPTAPGGGNIYSLDVGEFHMGPAKSIGQNGEGVEFLACSTVIEYERLVDVTNDGAVPITSFGWALSYGQGAAITRAQYPPPLPKKPQATGGPFTLQDVPGALVVLDGGAAVYEDAAATDPAEDGEKPRSVDRSEARQEVRGQRLGGPGVARCQ